MSERRTCWLAFPLPAARKALTGISLLRWLAANLLNAEPATFALAGSGRCIKLSATSRVLRAKRTEVVSPYAVMATQGMTAALAATTFLGLDSDGDGVISARDLVDAFSHVGGVSYAQACEMARLIVAEGDSMAGGGWGTSSRRSTRESAKGELEGRAEAMASGADGKLNFVEYCSVMAQDMMPFDQLLEYMDERAGRRAASLKAHGEHESSDDVGMSELEFNAARMREGIGPVAKVSCRHRHRGSGLGGSRHHSTRLGSVRLHDTDTADTVTEL